MRTRVRLCQKSTIEGLSPGSPGGPPGPGWRVRQPSGLCLGSGWTPGPALVCEGYFWAAARTCLAFSWTTGIGIGGGLLQGGFDARIVDGNSEGEHRVGPDLGLRVLGCLEQGLDDAGVAEAGQGEGRPTADGGIVVGQCGDQRFDGPGVSDPAEGRRDPLADLGVVIAEQAKQGRHGPRIAEPAEGSSGGGPHLGLFGEIVHAG